MNEWSTILRFVLCGAFQLLALVGLGLRLAFLHMGPHEAAREKLDASRKWECELDVARGRICDRDGHENALALDLSVRDVCVDPTVVLSNRLVIPVASALSEELDLPVDEVAVRINRPARRYERIQRAVQLDVCDRIAARRFPGVFFREHTVRFYPQGPFMCHILGFVNDERDGCGGIEQGMDRYLRGSPGLLESRKNALRQEIFDQRNRYIPAVEGADVMLTVDQYVQYTVEKVVDALMTQHRAKGASVIVQRVRTGEILAMASRPAFDLNDFGETDDNHRLNRSIGSVYEPGSTLKAVIFSAALEDRLVTPNTVIDCENGSWLHAKRILRDYHPYGKLTVQDGLKKSSNILSAKLAVRMGDRRFHEHLRAFGLGTRLGIDLPGEENGILHHPSRWSAVSSSRIAIGQGVAVTALQMLGVYCAIANDGLLMRPYIVDRVVAKDGTTLYQQRPEAISRPVSQETAALMRRLLARVTEDGGTGRRARVDGYPVAGKTGTAQKPVNGRYSSTDHVASFVGFLPADRPEIGIIVVVDEPQPLHTGGVVAAPGFKTIAGELVRYLGIPPATPQALARR